MPAAEAPDPAAEERKAAEAEAQRETAEANAKLAEKLEATAQTVASIAERVAQQQPQAAAQPAQQPQQWLTEEQVEQLIEAQKITRAQGMSYLMRKAREEAKAEARRETAAALNEVGVAAGAQQILGKIQQYQRAIPGLARKGSPEWNEVANRFEELKAEGYPDTIATELQALRELHGRDPSKIGETTVRDRTKERATRGQETSTPSARAAAPGRRRPADPDPDLPGEQREYVDKMIRLGQYKGWDDPRVKGYVERAKALSDRKRRA